MKSIALFAAMFTIHIASAMTPDQVIGKWAASVKPGQYDCDVGKTGAMRHTIAQARGTYLEGHVTGGFGKVDVKTYYSFIGSVPIGGIAQPKPDALLKNKDTGQLTGLKITGTNGQTVTQLEWWPMSDGKYVPSMYMKRCD